MQNNFKMASALEREKMKSLLTTKGIKYFTFTDDDGMDQYDGHFINSKNQSICFEVKNRAIASDKYISTMIEKSKFDFLMNQEIGQPYIFIFFNDNKVFIHKLKVDGDYFISKEFCPQTTMGSTTKILKDVVYIPIDTANLHIII